MKKPTKQYIERLVNWCGGTLTQLPYDAQQNTVHTFESENTSEGNALRPIVTQGFWAQFWYDVLRDMKYHRLQFHDELRGDAITLFPKDFPLRIPPTCPAKVNSAADQVNVGDPQVKVHLPDGFRSDDKRADLERRFALFGKGLIQTEEKSSDTDPLRDQVVNTIAYGMGVRTIMLDITRWPEKPQKKRRELPEVYAERLKEWDKKRKRISPFVTRSVHPLNVAYDRQGTPPQWAIIRESTNEWDAMEAYPEWEGPNEALPNSSTRTLVKTWFVTPEWVACFIDGKKALGKKEGADEEGIAPNPYGFINFWFSAGGAGEQDPYNRPEYELCGIIRKNRDILLADASIFNQEEVIRQRLAFGPKPVIKGPQAEERERIARQVLGSPLKGVDMAAGYSVENLENPEMPQALIDQRGRVKEDIDRGMVHDVASGSGTPSEPAARTRVRLFQVDKRFAAAVLHIQQSAEASIEAALYMIRDVLKEPVGVNVAQVGQPAEYVDIHPDDIPDGIMVEVNLIGDSEEEKARLLQIGDSRLANGTLDKFTYMQDFAKDRDPQEIVIGRVVDAVIENVAIPAVLAYFQGQVPPMFASALAAQGINLMPEVEAAAMQGMAAATGGTGMPGEEQMAPPPGGMPPVPPPAPGPQFAVGPNGAVLSGEGDNAMVARPNSPEGLAQTLQQGLPRLDQGPRVRMAL